MPIRPATQHDATAIAAIILPVIRAGETYALDPAMTQETALAYWLGRTGRASCSRRMAGSSAPIICAPIRRAAGTMSPMRAI